MKKKLNASDLFGGLARHALANVKLNEDMPEIAHQVLAAAQDAVSDGEQEDTNELPTEPTESTHGAPVINTVGESLDEGDIL